MSGPTPGPWRIGVYPHIASPGDVMAADGRLIARTCWRRGAESGANARLIAAAPEMFVALRDLVVAHGCDSAADEPCGECLGCRGSAVLAKAEGRQ